MNEDTTILKEILASVQKIEQSAKLIAFVMAVLGLIMIAQFFCGFASLF